MPNIDEMNGLEGAGGLIVEKSGVSIFKYYFPLFSLDEHIQYLYISDTWTQVTSPNMINSILF